MLVAFDSIVENGSIRETDRQKERIFRGIGTAQSTTRKRLAIEYGLRPATVTALVRELIEDGLVAEGKTLNTASKGRREVFLEPVPGRLITLVVHIVSHIVRGVLVDLTGDVVAEETRLLNPEVADNRVLSDAMREVALALLDKLPPGAEMTGIGISVPGIVDPEGRRWVYTSRWPLMAGLTFDDLEAQSGLPVRIERNLNVELRSRLKRRPNGGTVNILFVHWGYGIGSAYAHDGRVLSSGLGSLGEFGHWTVVENKSRICICGQKGCLETEAALWALLPLIREDFPDAPADEWAFARFLKDHDLAKHGAIQDAVGVFAQALRNLNMAFFPDEIIITGPFVQHPEIMSRLQAQFRDRLPTFAQDAVVLEVAQPGADEEIVGSALPLFQEALQGLLLARETRGY